MHLCFFQRHKNVLPLHDHWNQYANYPENNHFSYEMKKTNQLYALMRSRFRLAKQRGTNTLVATFSFHDLSEYMLTNRPFISTMSAARMFVFWEFL